MDSMQNCIMNDMNEAINDDEQYKLLLQLPNNDMTGFRIMSVLL